MSDAKWLASIAEVPDASDDSLKMQLITCDGRSKEMKQACLDELLRRATDREYHAMLDANCPPL